jgi:hypothetical protein
MYSHWGPLMPLLRSLRTFLARSSKHIALRAGEWSYRERSVRFHEMGGRVWDQPRKLYGLSPTSWARMTCGDETQGSAFGSTLGFVLSPAPRA